MARSNAASRTPKGGSAKVLRDPAASKDAKGAAASALTQSKNKNLTSAKSAAAKVLQDRRSPNSDPATRTPTARRTVSATAFEPSARARALLRGAEIAAKDLADAGGAYTLEQVQVLLNDVSRQSVDKKIRAGELLTVPGPSNIRRYPVIQFNDDRTVVAGLKDVQAALPGKTGWAVLNFLIHPDPRLGGQRPIDMLRRGKTAEVVAAAKLVGEPGA